ncbi:MAG: glycosyltransferase [Lachnospiraceae bacterium]|nr:glycosyltransferase [Lachnospiraceae bacterium]
MAFFQIIVVSYQPGDKLAATLSSILSQTEGSFSVIVKDAGSTDGSVEAARAAFPDARIRWIRSDDSGIYDGMNQALADLPEGEKSLVYFLNCGDLLYDSHVLARVKEKILADKEQADVATRPGIWYGDIVERRTGQRVAANPRIDAFACFRNVPNHQTCFYDAELMREERFDTKWRVRADYEHFLRCFFRKGVRPIPLNMVICDYEGGGFSESPEGMKISRQEHREITEIYYSRAQILRYRLYLALSLQPLRKMLSESRLTAGFYHRIRDAILRRR